MINLYLISFFIWLPLLYSGIGAQSKTHEHDVKEVLEKLFEYSANQKYKEAAALIAYSGEDENRNNNDTFNISDRMELNQVKRICLQIFALLELSEYHIGEYNATFDDGTTHYNLNIHFQSGEQEIIKRFQFIRTESEKYLLDQIN